MQEIIKELINFYKEIISGLAKDQKELYRGGFIERGEVYDISIEIYNKQILDLIKLYEKKN